MFRQRLGREFTSNPLTDGSAGIAYQYDAGRDVSQRFVNIPARCRDPDGAVIDPSTGLLSWTPTTTARESTVFEVRAIAADGSYSRQRWTVNVSGLNRPPVISSIRDATVTAGDCLTIRFFRSGS